MFCIKFCSISFQMKKYMAFSDKAAACVSGLLPQDKVMKLDQAVHNFQLDWKYIFSAFLESRVLHAYNMCFNEKNGNPMDRLADLVSHLHTYRVKWPPFGC